jgi:hypothetical protein
MAMVAEPRGDTVAVPTSSERVHAPRVRGKRSSNQQSLLDDKS